MATNNQDDDHKKAVGLQKAMETASQPSSQRTAATAQWLTAKQQLLALEKLEALPTTAADEVRNIVAEGIAEKFGETYRTFPCTREGTEIRRDAVPKQCALRKSVERFVANARAPEKTSKVKGQEGQKKVVTKTTTPKEHAMLNAPAKVHAAQRHASSNIGQAARCQKIVPRKTASPEKQLSKTSPNPSNPTKDGTYKDRQQTRLESGEKAWDVLLAQKAATMNTPARAGTQQKPTTQATGRPMAPVNQRAGVGARRGGRAAAVARPPSGKGAAKVTTAPQSLATAAGTTDGAPDRRTTTEELAKPESSSTRKANIDSSEDLIDFSF